MNQDELLSVAEPIDTTTKPVEATGKVPYEFNELIEVTFNARPKSPRPVMVTHKLRRPTFDELYARELKTAYRTREVGQDEEEVLPSTEDPNVFLYNKVIQEVSGGYNEARLIDFTTITDRKEREQALQRIPATHKNDVISVIYSFDSEVDWEDDDSDNFIWGDGQTYNIKTEIGIDPENPEFVITHCLKEPTELQLTNYSRDRSRIMIERGTKRPVSKVMTNLAAGLKLYDSLVTSVHGATVNGKPINVENPAELKMIDPIMKQSVVSALVKSLQVDLGK